MYTDMIILLKWEHSHKKLLNRNLEEKINSLPPEEKGDYIYKWVEEKTLA